MSAFTTIISFVFNGKIISINFSEPVAFKPSATVFEFLCTIENKNSLIQEYARKDYEIFSVSLAQLDGRGGLEYKSFDPHLLLLPMMHGKQLIINRDELKIDPPSDIYNFNAPEEEIIELLHSIADDRNTKILETMGLMYLKPFTLEEALRLKYRYPDALVINGLTHTRHLHIKNKMTLQRILDISDVAELNFMVEDKKFLAIGAGVNINEVITFCKRSMVRLAETLQQVGSVQIRNQITLSDIITTAVLNGGLISFLTALGSRLRLASVIGNRECKLEDCYSEHQKINIKPDELITLIIIPKLVDNEIIKSV